MQSFTLRQIKEREAMPIKGRRDFLARFLEAKDKFPQYVDEEQVGDYANTNVAGGSDTTGVILSTLLYRIIENESILKKILAEISSVLRARKEDQDADLPITFAEGSKMTYYQATLKESLRYHPVSAQMLPRVVPPGGVELCGHYLPEGTVVGCHAWSIHRRKELYGDDADNFRPERWLEVPKEQARLMEMSLFTFGAGKRACIGRNVAMLELSKFVPEFLRRFDARIVDPGRFNITSAWHAVATGLDLHLQDRPQESLLVD